MSLPVARVLRLIAFGNTQSPRQVAGELASRALRGLGVCPKPLGAVRRIVSRCARARTRHLTPGWTV